MTKFQVWKINCKYESNCDFMSKKVRKIIKLAFLPKID